MPYDDFGNPELHELLRRSLKSLAERSALLHEEEVSSGEGGIRTHAPLRTNGFQDRLVMTTSIPLRVLNTLPQIPKTFAVTNQSPRSAQKIF